MKYLISFILLFSVQVCSARGYFQIGAGMLAESENLNSDMAYDIRFGAVRGKWDYSLGMSRYYSDMVKHSPSRLVPGDIDLILPSAEVYYRLPYGFKIGGGVGYSVGWHRPVNKHIGLHHLPPYEPDERLINVESEIKPSPFYVLGMGYERPINRDFELFFGIRYLFLRPKNERCVTIYAEDYSIFVYDDRYREYMTERTLNLDSLIGLVGVRVYF